MHPEYRPEYRTDGIYRFLNPLFRVMEHIPGDRRLLQLHAEHFYKVVERVSQLPDIGLARELKIRNIKDAASYVTLGIGWWMFAVGISRGLSKVEPESAPIIAGLGAAAAITSLHWAWMIQQDKKIIFNAAVRRGLDVLRRRPHFFDSIRI